MCAAAETALRSDEGQPVVGPFGVLGGRFVVESPDRDLLSRLAAGYADLAVDGAASDATVYRVEQTGPAWHPYGWSIWRDHELVSAEALGTFLPTLIPSDFARRWVARRSGAIAVTGLAIVRDERAILLAVDVVDRQASVVEAPIDLPALGARAMQRGWGLVALDVVPIDATGATAVVRPFHRPFAAERDTQLAAQIGATRLDELVPASTLGSLAERCEVGAVVSVRPAADRPASLVEASPAAVLQALAANLSGPAGERRSSFVHLADLVEGLPCRVLEAAGDLDATLELLERAS